MNTTRKPSNPVFLAALATALFPMPGTVLGANCKVDVPLETAPSIQHVNSGNLALGRALVRPVGAWHNRKNRFQGRPVILTLDLDIPRQLQGVHLDCNPPNKWYSVNNVVVETSTNGTEWQQLAEKQGPGPTRESGTVPFSLTAKPAETTEPARYVRAVITPQPHYRLMIREFSVTLAPTSSVRAGIAKLASETAFYEPDGPLDAKWAEAGFWGERWREFDPGVPKLGGPGAYIKTYVHNQADRPATVDGLYINGASVDTHLHVTRDDDKGVRGGIRKWASLWIDADQNSESFQKLLQAGEPVWYKAEPNPIPAGGRAELVIRLRNQPSEPVALEINLGGSRKSVLVVPRRPDIDVLYATFADGLKEAVVFVRNWSGTDAQVARILFDGSDMIGQVEALQESWLPSERRPFGLAAFRIRFSAPLQPGSFHTIGLATVAGHVFRTQVRAWSNPFVIGMMGHAWRETDEEYFEILSRHHFNSVLWAYEGERLHTKHRLLSIPRPEQCPAMTQSLLAYYNLDEPDVKDYFCKEIDQYWRRPGATAHYCLAKRRQMLENSPETPGMLLVNSTFKPVNYATYAQLSDFAACDPYAPRKKPAFGLHYVTALTSATAVHAEPKPVFTLLYCSGNVNNGFMRYPTPEEELLMATYALSAGAKGIGYYWWRGQYGLVNNPSLLRGLSEVNARLAQIGALVTRSVPTGWGSVNSKTVHLETLWAAGKGLVLLLTNEDQTCNADQDGTTVLAPVENVTVSCPLPQNTDSWQLFEIKPLAWEPWPETAWRVDTTTDPPMLKLTVGAMVTARWFVYAPRPF